MFIIIIIINAFKRLFNYMKHAIKCVFDESNSEIINNMP